MSKGKKAPKDTKKRAKSNSSQKSDTSSSSDRGRRRSRSKRRSARRGGRRRSSRDRNDHAWEGDWNSWWYGWPGPDAAAAYGLPPPGWFSGMRAFDDRRGAKMRAFEELGSSRARRGRGDFEFSSFGGRGSEEAKPRWQPGAGRNLDLEAERMTGSGLARFHQHDDRRAGPDLNRSRGDSPGGMWGHDRFEDKGNREVRGRGDVKANAETAEHSDSDKSN